MELSVCVRESILQYSLVASCPTCTVHCSGKLAKKKLCICVGWRWVEFCLDNERVEFMLHWTQDWVLRRAMVVWKDCVSVERVEFMDKSFHGTLFSAGSCQAA